MYAHECLHVFTRVCTLRCVDSINIRGQSYTAYFIAELNCFVIFL